ncbi:MAG: uncharacterized protein QOD06_123 [Candidatus Binatota bacterium]|jgi:predicted MPP superfamily phosphohydrolase|nr:uncharacterized protein [Candidatus Binatota bacterium]
MTGRERRHVNPDGGIFKLAERSIDRFASRYVYPRIGGIATPYSWLLPRRFAVADGRVFPPRWPRGLPPLRVLLLSDIHTGPFIDPRALAPLVDQLMQLAPDLVAIAGDAVSGEPSDLDDFLPVLAPLARAPLGAWYCFGNHDYFSGEPEGVSERWTSIGIRTLKNESTDVACGAASFRIGGIDDRLLGTPDWEALAAGGAAPDLLLAHNPDDFYEAESRGAALVLSGHTHGGQIRLPGWPPIVRHSRFCLDEGAYAYGDALLVVTRGVGASGLPWRVGAHPEAVMLTIRSATP